MVMTTDLLHGFRVGEWTVEPLKGAITGPDDEPHHLQPKVMDLLVCLAANAGEPVTREELLDKVWGEYTVSDEPLTRAIGELRRALGDSSNNPSYVETIPKRGYRLIEQVVIPEPPASAESAASSRTSHQKSRLTLYGVAGLAVLAVLFIMVRILAPESGTGAIDPAPPNSIAVMPFTTCIDDETATVLAAGIAQEVRIRLAARENVAVSIQSANHLLVVARTSSLVFWQAGMTPEEVGRELKVRYLLVGEVCREGDVLMTTVSLVNNQGYLLQTRRFEQGAGSTPDTMSNRIAGAVSGWLGAEPSIPDDSPVNKESREYLVLAREYLARGEFSKAQAAIDEALRLQPDYAAALFERALMELNGLDLDQGQGMMAAKEIIEDSLQTAIHQYLMDPTGFESTLTVGRFIAAMAYLDENLSWRGAEVADPELIQQRYSEAEEYLGAAFSMNPSSSIAAQTLADVLDAQGKKEESQAVLESAHLNDPFNLDLNWRIALHWAATNRYDEAVALIARFNGLPFASARTWNWQLELMQIHGHWDDQVALLIELLTEYPDIAAHGQIRFQVAWIVGDLMRLGLTDHAEAWRARLPLEDLPEWARLTTERFYLYGKGDQQELTRRTRERLAGMSDSEVLDAWVYLPMSWAADLAAGGETERAIAILEKLLTAPTLRDERDTRVASILARLYVRVGRESDAEQLLERLSSHLELEVAAGIHHPESLFRIAEVYALQGKNESAIHALQMAIDNHWRMPWWELPWKTTLNGLDTDPRVAALRRQVEEDLEHQAEKIRMMLAEHDVDELLAPLSAVL
jgi:DNA-binding winged helix-turn-helix (wHTH) protein/tetratricopeptide (TPR) repeat protein